MFEVFGSNQRQIFICGHGGWQLKNGYATVPANTSITFYTQNAKLLHSTDVIKLIQGTFAGEPDSSLGEYRTVPNMTLWPDDPPCRKESRDACPQNKGLLFWKPGSQPPTVDLKEIFRAYPGHDFVWACCRDLTLTQTGRGQSAGINAGEFVDRYYFFDAGGHHVPK
jgi:hypothetical protein